MQLSSKAATHILGQANRVLNENEPDELKLERLWHTLMVLRANILAGLLQNAVGPRVMAGPFKGMQLTPAAMTKVYAPVLTGQYEHELHMAVEKLAVRPYQRVINIGCAFGYYSVGIALRMPQVTVDAFDILEVEQEQCRAMAELNGVADRVKTGGEFRGEDFASYAGSKTLLLMDIEGAEKQLLDPAHYPALAQMDILVEMHDVKDETLSKLIPERFAATHDIEIVYNKPNLFDFEPLLGKDYYNPLDSLLITWENRAGPTPWAVMLAK